MLTIHPALLLPLLLLHTGSAVAVPALASRSPTVKQQLLWWSCWLYGSLLE
jgi:hypothetical protein